MINGSNYYFDSKDQLIIDYMPYFFDQKTEQKIDGQFVVNNLNDIGYDINHTLSIDILKNIFNAKFNIKKCILDDAADLERSLDFNRTLGLLLRGTNYSKKLTSVRNQQLLLKILQMTHKLLNVYKLETIFLITEDKKILQAFKESFKNKVYSCNQYVINTEGPLFDCKLNSMEIIDLYQKYLRNIILLSKMKYVMMSTTNASILYNILRKDRPFFSYTIR